MLRTLSLQSSSGFRYADAACAARIALACPALEAEAALLIIAHAARHPGHLPLARAALDAVAARLGYPDRVTYARVFAWSTCLEWFRRGYSLAELFGVQVRASPATHRAQHAHQHMCASCSMAWVSNYFRVRQVPSCMVAVARRCNSCTCPTLQQLQPLRVPRYAGEVRG